MSNRRGEDGRQAQPPPAPPLPPQTSPAKAAANAVVRFAHGFNYGFQNVGGEGAHLSGCAGPRLNDRLYASPVASRNNTHKTGIPIAALDISPDRTRAVIAGREILKTVNVSGSTSTEDFNLKENIKRYTSTHESSGNSSFSKQRDPISANDVKWSNGDFQSTIAIAAANGQIVVYDLNRVSVELARLHGHNRQVHRLAFSPHWGSLLLSGSQDATVRLWDLRTLSGEKSVMTCQSRSRYAGNSDGVRDVRWCPSDALEFAIGTDSGTIQHWDIRKDNSPLVKVNAHETICSSVDWHPAGKHLVSGSADKRAKVWDLSSSDRRMKPQWQLLLPFAASNVRWRPAEWSVEDNRPGNWHCTQMAVSYDKVPIVHVWDLRRPSVSSRVLDLLEMSPSDLLWQSEDLLWSVDSSGTFTQTDVPFARKTVDTYNLNPFAIAPNGQIIFASMKREPRRLSIEEVADDVARSERRGASRSDRIPNITSASQGSHEEPSLLTSSFKNRRSKVVGSLRSNKSTDSTPPSNSSEGPLCSLHRSLNDSYLFKPSQVITKGLITGVMDAEVFAFLAEHYKAPESLPSAKHGFNVHLVLAEAFAHNENVARQARQFRLAQIWKMLGHAMLIELGERARRKLGKRQRTNHEELRLEHGTADADLEPSARHTFPPTINNTIEPVEEQVKDFVMPRKSSGELSNPPLLPQNIEQHDFEKVRSKDTKPGRSRVEQLQDLRISGDQIRQARHTPEPIFADMDRQIAERRAAMETFRAQPRSVLKFDGSSQVQGQTSQAFQPSRNDSTDSLHMSPGSAESSSLGQSTVGSFESNAAGGSTTGEALETRKRAAVAKMDQAENAMIFDDEAEMAYGNPDRLLRQTGKGEDLEMDAELLKVDKKLLRAYRPVKMLPALVKRSDMEPYPFPVTSPPDSIPLRRSDLIEDDFKPERPNEEDDVSEYEPWSATRMIVPLITFHAEKLFDAQLPTYLLLYLAPYLYVPIRHDRAQQIVLAYHDRLYSLELYVEAAKICQFSSTRYPAIADLYDQGIHTGGPWCTNCQKRVNSQESGICKGCDRPLGDCSVCYGLGPTVPKGEGITPADYVFIWCQVCGHMAHKGCLRTMWSRPGSVGACPQYGCECDCGPGARRDEKNRQMEEAEKKESSSFVVNKDEWKAKESGAVARARGMIGTSSGSGTEAGRGILQQGGRGKGEGGSASGGPMSLAAAGRSASEGKKVRIVEPEVVRSVDED